jgi:DNA-binding Lrp family transcriptional regulator
MKDKKDSRNFLLIPVDLTDRIHLYSGPWRDLWSTIYNFSKDGIHTYRAPMDELAASLHISERTAITIVNTLVESGYITREKKTVICSSESKHAKYEYKANIEGLLARLDAGEDVQPRPLIVLKKKGEKISPIIESEKGEKISPKGVKKFPKKGEKISSQNKEYNKEYYKDSLFESAHAREAEEREFYKIFFLNNAADPAAEVKRFVGYYQSKGWEDTAGRKYDTPEKRAGLAYGWEFKSGQRLEKNERTDSFYKFINALYEHARVNGGIDPMLLLDTRGGFAYADGVFTWNCTATVKHWFEGLGIDTMRSLVYPYMGYGCRLMYTELS